MDEIDEESVRLTESSIKRGLIANAMSRRNGNHTERDPVLLRGDDDDDNDVDDNDLDVQNVDDHEDENSDDRGGDSWVERRRRQRVRADQRGGRNRSSNGSDDRDDHDNDEEADNDDDEDNDASHNDVDSSGGGGGGGGGGGRLVDNEEESSTSSSPRLPLPPSLSSSSRSSSSSSPRDRRKFGSNDHGSGRLRERAIVVRHRNKTLPKVRGGQVTSFVERANLTANGLSLPRHGNANDEGFVPPWVAFHVRSYLDVLFGAVTLEKIRLVKLRNRRSEFAVPNVVDSILRYNNIAFAAVEMCWVNGTQLVEPIWYDIDTFNNRLQLYISQSMYDAFCARQSDDPVNMASGVVPVENYDPYATSPEASGPLDKATVNCAIACDHVAQHIIAEVLRPERVSPGADIHDRFTEVGCTLHSMLDIVAVTAREAGRCLGLGGGDDGGGTRTVRDTSSYLTLLDNHATDWRAAAARRGNLASTASLYGSSCPFDTSTGAYDYPGGGGDLLRPVTFNGSGDGDDHGGIAIDGGVVGGGYLDDGSRFDSAYAFEETIA